MTSSAELDALPCSVVVTDLHGQILCVNAFAVTTFKIEHRLQFERIEQLFPPASLIFLQTHLWPMLRQHGALHEIYLTIKRHEQTALPVLINVLAGEFNNNPCYRWVILPAEQRALFEQELITARTQMQEYAQTINASRHMLQAVLDGAQDIAIIALSHSGHICFCNSGTATLLGNKVNNIEPVHISQMLQFAGSSLGAATRLKTLLENIDSSVVSDAYAEQFETQIIDQNDKTIDVLVQLRCLAKGLQLEGANYVLLLSDISQRKQFERLQNEFIANISHEFRTPLTSILGSLSILGSGSLGPLPTKAQKLVNITLTNVRRLKLLVTDMLDFAKLKAHKMSVYPRSVELKIILEQSLDEHKYYLTDKAVQLMLYFPAEPVSVWADPDRLLQVVSNLMSNAIKFTLPNTAVIMSVMLVDDNQVKIGIKDHGSGVKNSFVPLLFTQFTQQDSASNRKHEGTGLGLAISKELVQAMGGDIGYTHADTGGAEFWFTLPLVNPQ